MQMGVKHSSGYTIIEVTLFLAISGMLLTIIMIGTGSTLHSTRFSDSSRSLYAYIQKKYDDILNGLNIRGSQEACSGGVVNPTPPTSDPTGASNCLLLGKLILLQSNASTLQEYTIVGTEPANPNYSQSDESLIYDYQPKIITNSGVESYAIPWQAIISGSKREADSKAVDALAIIRSPRSTHILTYTYKTPIGNYNLYDLINPANSADANNFNTPTNNTNFCLRSADNVGSLSKLVMSGGQGQNAVQLSFTVGGTDCDGS